MAGLMNAFGLIPDFPNLPDAACKGIDEPEAFFSFEPRKTEQARQVCRRCPAIRSCLAWALTHQEAGIWAGTDESQRAQLLARHARSTS